MSEALSAVLWLWVCTPIATIGAVVALLVADAQWRRAQEWRRRTWTTISGATGTREGEEA